MMRFVPKSKRPNNNLKTNIFMKNFPQGWSQEQVQQFIDTKMSAFGEITSSSVKFNEKNANHFAFANYKTEADAQKALEEMRSFEVEGVILEVVPAMKKRLRSKLLSEKHAKATNDTNLFVRSLNIDVTLERLKEVFGKYGEITSAVIRKAEKVPRIFAEKNVELQFAYVNYAQADSASRAFSEAKKNEEVLALINEYHDSRKEFISFFQSKNVRIQFIKMQKKNLSTQHHMQQQFLFMQMLQNFQSQAMQAGRGKGGKMGNPVQMMQAMQMGMNMGMNMNKNPQFGQRGMPNAQMPMQPSPQQLQAMQQQQQMHLMQM